MFRCYCERSCLTNCTCGGTKEKSYLDCSGKTLIYFPKLYEITVSFGQIILKDNNIEHFPRGGIGFWPNVWSIDISGNKIMNVEGNEIHQMFSNLSILDLSRNQIRQIKHTPFFALHSLNSLFLDRNYISYIYHGGFDKLTNLTFLNLANNHLKVLNLRWFINMKSLSSLYLEDNRIERVISWMYPWPASLKRVSLNNNKIPVILPIPKHAEMFNLDGNPTYCGCRPENFTLNDISNFTLCKVRIQCNSIKIKRDCKDKRLYEEVYKFWQNIVTKPICQAPVIEELATGKNYNKLSHLTCVARGFPAPNITLFSNDTEQKLQVRGVVKTNFTSVTINQLFSGTYHCSASNIVDEITRNLVVDLNKLEVTQYFSTLNLTSEKVSFLTTDLIRETSLKTSKSIIHYSNNRETDGKPPTFINYQVKGINPLMFL